MATQYLSKNERVKNYNQFLDASTAVIDSYDSGTLRLSDLEARDLFDIEWFNDEPLALAITQFAITSPFTNGRKFMPLAQIVSYALGEYLAEAEDNGNKYQQYHVNAAAAMGHLVGTSCSSEGFEFCTSMVEEFSTMAKAAGLEPTSYFSWIADFIMEAYFVTLEDTDPEAPVRKLARSTFEFAAEIRQDEEFWTINFTPDLDI